MNDGTNKSIKTLSTKAWKCLYSYYKSTGCGDTKGGGGGGGGGGSTECCQKKENHLEANIPNKVIFSTLYNIHLMES